MVRIVTDSTADLPEEIMEALGITVVPAYVIFGQKSYKDGIDISKDEFYQKLTEEKIHPTTSTATPEEFAKAYLKLAEQDQEIISLHLSPSFSRIYESALQGKEQAEKEKPNLKVEVIDTRWVVMAMGFLVIKAAKLAAEKKQLAEIVEEIKETIPRIRFLAVLDTLKYLKTGGRAQKAVGQGITALLNVKMLLTIKDGEAVRAGMVKVPKKIERFVDFIKRSSEAREIAIEYSTNLEEAQSLREKVKATFPEAVIYFSQVTPVIGTHAGPGILAVSVLS